MKKYKELAIWALFTAMIICTFTPFIYWGFNSHMTYMEVFHLFWPIYIVVFIIYLINQKLLKL